MAKAEGPAMVEAHCEHPHSILTGETSSRCWLPAVNRVTSPPWQVTSRAPHSAGGHADRCDALALALRAVSAPAPIRPSGEAVRTRPSIGDMGLGKFRAGQWPL